MNWMDHQNQHLANYNNISLHISAYVYYVYIYICMHVCLCTSTSKRTSLCSGWILSIHRYSISTSTEPSFPDSSTSIFGNISKAGPSFFEDKWSNPSHIAGHIGHIYIYSFLVDGTIMSLVFDGQIQLVHVLVLICQFFAGKIPMVSLHMFWSNCLCWSLIGDIPNAPVQLFSSPIVCPFAPTLSLHSNRSSSCFLPVS